MKEMFFMGETEETAKEIKIGRIGTLTYMMGGLVTLSCWIM